MPEPSPFSDRLNRLSYFVSSLFVGGAAALLIQVFGPHPLSLLVAVASIVASTILGVRRLHDLDRSGWAFLLVVFPFVNLGFLLYLTFAKGTAGPNQYGVDPLR